MSHPLAHSMQTRSERGMGQVMRFGTSRGLLCPLFRCRHCIQYWIQCQLSNHINLFMTTSLKYDVAVIGGGIIGSAAAYFLLKEAPSLRVCVVEADSTYEFASTLRASGGCRVQFTCPENIEMSKYSIDFIKDFETT